MTYQPLPAGAPLTPFLPPRYRKQAQPRQTPLIKSQSNVFFTKATKDNVMNEDTWWIPFLMGRWGGRRQEVVPTKVPVTCYYPQVCFLEISYIVKVGTSGAYTKDSLFIISSRGWNNFPGTLRPFGLLSWKIIAWVASAMETYCSQFWRQEVQDQSTGKYAVWWECASWFPDGFLLQSPCQVERESSLGAPL